MNGFRLLRLASIAAALVAMSNSARADLIETKPNASFAQAPYTIAFGDGAASYTFSAGSTWPAAVTTGGTALVASYGEPFFDPPRPAAYLGPGLIADDTFASWLAYPTATAIPFSDARIFVGLEFTAGDGVHFGYAELLRTTLLSYAYETRPGQKIIIGADPVIPEPASALLLVGALVGFTTLRAVSRSPR
jgi:hypothetical protein